MATDNRPRSVEPNSGGGGIGVVLVFLGLVCIIGPFFASVYIHGMAQLILMIFGVALLVAGGVIITITSLYRKSSAQMAFVRTGSGGPKAIINGGALVIPQTHTVTYVSLEAVRLSITRKGKESFITADNLHVDVVAEFFIRVNGKEEDVLAAASALGARCGDDEKIMELEGDKLISALRTIAAKSQLTHLHQNLDEYRDEVKKIVEHDLKPHGLVLETIAITYLNQTPASDLDPKNNIFDAQGARQIAEITNTEMVTKTKAETDAAQQIKTLEVDREKRLYTLEVDQSNAAAERDSKITMEKAKRNRESTEFQADQDRMGKLAQVASSQAVEVAGVEKERAVQIASATQEREVQQAQIARDQAVQTAAVKKEQAIEVQKREQAIAVAQAEERRAAAETLRVAAQTEQVRKEQNKLTVEQTAAAERQKSIAVIGKQAAAEQSKIEEFMRADVEKNRQVKQAEGAAEAASKDAEATRTKALAEKDAAMFRAEGATAEQSVAVEVLKKGVEVEAAKVEVERTRVAVEADSMKNKEQYGKAALDFQVRIRMFEAVENIAKANADMIGKALAASNMTFYGDANTFQTMLTQLSAGQATGKFVEGLMDSTPDKVKTLVFDSVDKMSDAAAGILNKMTGGKLDVATLAMMIQAEMSKPNGTAATTASGGSGD